ncbi:peptide cleavage/export ABC transporter, partial [Vagococcus fluvialis]|uniref:peptide cleavage/export ABC transporter n=1 Tax=Vagococcus fluvialis TaxID=2738 RepID=UPI00378F6938
TLILTPSDNFVAVKEKTNGLSSFLPILLKQKGLIFNVILLSFLITLFGIVSSYYFQGVIDFFIPNSALSSLNIISIGLIVMYVFQLIFDFSRNYLLLIMGQKMSMEIMLSYFKHVLNLPMNFFSTRKSGEIISRFLDANKIIDALGSATLTIFLDLTMVITIGIVLAIQNMSLFLITLVSLPLYTVIILGFVKSYNKATEEEMQAGAQVNSSIIESLDGIETIKAYNSEEKVYQKVDEEFVSMLRKSFKTSQLDNLQQTLKTSVKLIISGIILWVGSYFVINGQISIGQLITYNALLTFFTDPLQNIINLQTKLQTARIANNRLHEVFDIEEEKRVPNKRFKRRIFKKDITLQQVTFAYGTRSPVLKDITMTVPGGSKVALVGQSGSGKSTLAKLLVNFYQPQEGHIKYDRMDNLDIDHRYLRKHVSYVPQDSFFFSGTLLENLIFGLKPDEVDFEAILNTCEAVGILEFINQSPLRFDTLIEEGGVNLSGGQKQRLAIVRALLRKSSILILDEATSAMDPILESQVVKYILSLTNKTVIIIAHRLSIAQKCDKVFVLERGELVEEGHHDDLLLKNGVYYQLWNVV